MSEEVEEAIYTRLAGQSRRAADALTFDDKLDGMRAALGSWKSVASAFGVNERTVRRWKSGESGITPGTEQRANVMWRRLLLPPGREARIRAGRSGLHIMAQITVQGSTSDDRMRDLDLTDWIESGDLGPLVDAYLRGDDQDAERSLYDVISNRYIAGVDGLRDVVFVKM